jgi:hypothetical protein
MRATSVGILANVNDLTTPTALSNAIPASSHRECCTQDMPSTDRTTPRTGEEYAHLNAFIVNAEAL